MKQNQQDTKCKWWHSCGVGPELFALGALVLFMGTTVPTPDTHIPEWPRHVQP